MQFDGNEIEIDLKDLLGRALIKWKIGLVLALVFAVILAGVQYIRYENAQKSEAVYDEMDLNTAKAAMTDDETEEAERVYAQYQTYFRLLEYQRDLMDHSVLMTLDPATAVSKDRQYMIYSRQSDIVDTIKGLILNQELYEKLAAYIGDPDYADYVSELVTITGVGVQTGQGISLGGEQEDGETALTIIGAPTADGSSRYQTTMHITVIGGDEAFCDGIIAIVEQSFISEMEKLKTTDPEISYDYLGERLLRDTKRDIATRQRQMLESVSSLVTERKNFLTNTVQKLTAEQQAYISILGLRDDIKEPEETTGRGLAKMAVIGFALGLILFLGVLFLKYLFGGRIRTARELESATGLRMMRLASSEKEKKSAPKWDIIRRWGEKLTHGEKALSVTDGAAMTAVELSSDENAGGVFAIVPDGAESAAWTFADRLKKACGETGCKLETGDPLSDKGALTRLLEADRAIVVVGVDESARNAVFDACRLSIDHKKPLLGYVAVEA